MICINTMPFSAAVPQVGRRCVSGELFRVWLAGCRRKEVAKGWGRGDRPCLGGLCRQGTDHPRDGGAAIYEGAVRGPAPLRVPAPAAHTTAPAPLAPGCAAAPPPGPAASQ